MNHTTSPTAASGSNPRRRKVMLGLAGFFLLVALAVFAWWLLVARFRATTDNAYVGGNVVQVTSQVSGTVVGIEADDTDLVEAGQVLVRLDDADARIALQSAEAALADAVRGVRGLYAGAGQSSAVVAQRAADIERLRQEYARADAEWRRARDDLARKEELARAKFISPEALTVSRTALQSAEAARSAAKAAVDEGGSALEQAKEQKVGADVLVDNTSVETHPRVAAAAAKVREAYLALSRTQIKAPLRGHVARRKVQLGERLASGAALMAVIPDEQMWVDANFKETELENLRIGQPVTLTADAWGGDVTYHGKVYGLASGTGSAFAVLPAQNASGNWIKIVQRVPVRIVLDPAELASHPLRIGLSMRVDVDTNDRSGPLLVGESRKDSTRATDVFAAQAREADALIARVVAANRSGGK
jgi:membrane fusion protein (multidrug efflux system)